MNQQEYVLNLLNKLSKNRDVHSFLKKNQLDFSIVEKNSDIFEDWVNDIHKCRNCQGLMFCSQKIKGRAKTIYMDGKYLETSYVPCKYKKENDQSISHKVSFRRADLNESDYLIDLKKIDIASQSQDYVLAYALVAQSIENDKGIYLYGQPGVGKTYLMTALANHYAKEKKSVSFAKVPQLIQECKESIGNDADGLTQILAQLKYCDILFLDDIGSEGITQWTRDGILFPILNYRMDNKLKTYFTSNYTMKELERQYYLKGKDDTKVAANRLMERIRAVSDDVQLKGESRR